MAVCSLTPDVLAHFQCHDCGFNAAGTYPDVEIARRAHRHPNSSVVAIDTAQTLEVWTKYFESLPPLLVDSARLPQPYPRLYIWGATLTGLIVTAGGALFSRWLVEYSALNPWLWKWGHPVFMLLLIGGLVYTLLRYENDHRAATIHRLRTVAECNHHIRNALQGLTFTYDARIQQRSLEVSRRIAADSVRRIKLTLAKVLPRVL